MKYKILVINDDGPSSPLIEPFLDALKRQDWVKELRVTLPADESSWIGHGLTRFLPLDVIETHIGTHPGYLVTGKPADCAMLGVHHLYPDKPDFVFSGINVGINSGSAWFLSSGTIGGAQTAALTAMNSAALSAQVAQEIFKHWKAKDELAIQAHADDWKRIAENATRICKTLIEAKAWQEASCYSVNIPWAVTAETDLVVTQMQQTYLPNLFEKLSKSTYHFKFQPLELEPADHQHLDHSTVLSGKVAVTPIARTFSKDVSPDLKQKIEVRK